MSPVTVIFLDKNRIQLYQSHDRKGTVVSMDVPVSMMRDMEITDARQLESSFTALLTQHHITPSVAVIVLSDAVVLSMELVGAKDERSQQFQQFLAAVPFETVSSRMYPLADKEFAVAVSRVTFEPLVNVLEKHRFPIAAVVPSLVLGPMRGKRWLDAEMATYVAGKATAIDADSILPMENVSVPGSSAAPLGVNLLTIGIGVFIVLVIFLILLLSGRV